MERKHDLDTYKKNVAEKMKHGKCGICGRHHDKTMHDKFKPKDPFTGKEKRNG